jgi:hypothetical protein
VLGPVEILVNCAGVMYYTLPLYLPHPPRRIPHYRLYELWSVLLLITSPRVIPKPPWTHLRTRSDTSLREHLS